MRFLNLLFLFFLFGIPTNAQDTIQQQINNRGEAIVTFPANYLSQIPRIGSYSVDNIKDGIVTLYINARQYQKLLKLNIPLTVAPIASVQSVIKMASIAKETSSWDSYPTYDAYVAMMKNFATTFPSLCRLDTIGKSVEGRLILALKISDHVNIEEAEPKVFFTSSMHGDEVTGYVLMLRLASYLLNNTNNTQVAELVNGLEIYINPLANPDGTYYTGNSTVQGAIRYNANYVDLNRNFPDPIYGNYPNDEEWQPETVAMMNYMQKRHFSLSINFHGGSEVMNYPWDSNFDLHPDDSWFQLICRQYVDTVHTVDETYMTDLNNGITNGANWYVIAGGRQDYMTYFLHGREVTTELSYVKTPNASELPNYWNKNYRSMLNYMNQALYGLAGKVVDEAGAAISASLTVLNHDTDSSFVSTQDSGAFFRFLKGGTYNLLFKAEGFEDNEVDGVIVKDFSRTELTVVMLKNNSVADLYQKTNAIYPNPAKSKFWIKLSKPLTEKLHVTISTIHGRVILDGYYTSNEISVGNFIPGVYIVRVMIGNQLYIIQSLLID